MYIESIYLNGSYFLEHNLAYSVVVVLKSREIRKLRDDLGTMSTTIC
jgi:hypothetical protein